MAKTVLLAIKGTIVDGNLIKFSGVTGIGEDAGVASLNVKKCKFDATLAPTVNDDVDLGYVVGSQWYDVTADRCYICLDNSDGAAIWGEITVVVNNIIKTGTLVVGDLVKVNNVSGIIEPAGVAVETTLSPALDTKIPTSKAVNTHVTNLDIDGGSF